MTARPEATASAAPRGRKVAPRGRKVARMLQQRWQRQLKELQREIEDRAARTAHPRNDDAPPPRID